MGIPLREASLGLPGNNLELPQPEVRVAAQTLIGQAKEGLLSSPDFVKTIALMYLSVIPGEAGRIATDSLPIKLKGGVLHRVKYQTKGVEAPQERLEVTRFNVDIKGELVSSERVIIEAGADNSRVFYLLDQQGDHAQTPLNNSGDSIKKVGEFLGRL